MAPSTSAPFEVEHDAAPGFFSSMAAFFLPTAHAEAPAKDDAEDKDDSAEEKEEKEDGGDEEAASGGDDEEEEEEEPEDPAPAIRQECEEGECKAPAKHFKHCSEKVEAGEGWHGEDCVEELFHLMHCVDGCAAPKVFKKLA